MSYIRFNYIIFNMYPILILKKVFYFSQRLFFDFIMGYFFLNILVMHRILYDVYASFINSFFFHD